MDFSTICLPRRLHPIVPPDRLLRVLKGEHQVSTSPAISVTCRAKTSTLLVSISNHGHAPSQLTFEKQAYGTQHLAFELAPNEQKTVQVDLSQHGNWYDFKVAQTQGAFEHRFGGRMENGHHSISDIIVS